MDVSIECEISKIGEIRKNERVKNYWSVNRENGPNDTNKK